MAWKDKKVIITGGSGFVGSHLTEDLVQKGARVTLLVRPGSSLERIESIRSQVTIREGDTQDGAAVLEAVKKFQPEIIFHLAALSDPKRDLSLLEPSLKANVQGTISMLKAAKETKLSSFVFPGTSEAYGNNKPPFKETQKEDPVSPYSLSKCAAELCCRMFSSTFGVPTVIVRPFQVYGPGQKPGMFIPSLIKSIVDKKDFVMTPGEQKRDFIFVKDVVAGMEQAALSKHQNGEVFNLGTGKPVSIAHVAEQLVKLADSSIKIKNTMPYRENENMLFSADISKAKKELGWQPETTLESGLRETLAWYVQKSRGAQ